MDLAELLRTEQRRLYARARGGASAPAAGCLYWGGLALAGNYLTPHNWMLLAFFTSGLIFPLALLLQKPLGANILVKSPLSGAILPAFVSMLTATWSITISAFLTFPTLVPLTLAIGLALHWPAIGWLYGRTILYSGHLIVRTAAVLFIWFGMPDARLTLLPAAVSAVYLFTMLIILIDAAAARRRLPFADANPDDSAMKA
jgi:hypothetical protein